MNSPIQAASIAHSEPITLEDYRRAEDAGGIVYFDGTEEDFLSNFYPAPITFLGEEWRTSEHAYQAMKFFSIERQQAVKRAKGPGEAKRLGRALPGMREDWDEVKFGFMIHIVRTKFEQHPNLASRLSLTGERPLIEGNHWHDRVWGFCLCFEHRGTTGLNALGKTLSLIRQELRQYRESVR